MKKRKKTVSKGFPLLFALFLLPASLSAQEEKIVCKGSDTLGAKMVPQLMVGYRSAGHPVIFEIAAEGSSTAFSSLLDGSAQIGMSSRKVKPEEAKRFTEQGLELKEYVAAFDVIAVIVNATNPVDDLSLEQVEGLFTGDLTDWSEVGGSPGPISVYTRNTSSGTYKSFQELAMRKRPYGDNTQKMGGCDFLADEVAKNPSGTGYAGLAYIHTEGTKPLSIEGILPSNETCTQYPLTRRLYYYTVGEPQGETAKFLKWAIESEEAREIVEGVGFIPVPATIKIEEKVTPEFSLPEELSDDQST